MNQPGAPTRSRHVSSPSFFVSYARPDAPYVMALVGHLRDCGLPVWLDLSMAWGTHYVREIRQRVREALAIIVVMSPAAESSAWVEREILEGQRHDRDFLPILRQGGRLFLLASSNYFDARTGALPGDDEISQLRVIRDSFDAGADLPSLTLPPTPTVPAPAPRQPSSTGFAAPVNKLRSFLAEGQLEYADIFTTSLLLESVARLDNGWLRPADGERLSGNLLAHIDAAWADFSDGTQGFRAQLTHHSGPPPGIRPGRHRDFSALAMALGWRSGETFPRYGEFVQPTGHRPGFFPTLRNPQLEQYHSWHDQWLETVMAVHLRLRTWKDSPRHA